jgi:hypothetical protein
MPDRLFLDLIHLIGKQLTSPRVIGQGRGDVGRRRMQFIPLPTGGVRTVDPCIMACCTAQQRNVFRAFTTWIIIGVVPQIQFRHRKQIARIGLQKSSICGLMPRPIPCYHLSRIETAKSQVHKTYHDKRFVSGMLTIADDRSHGWIDCALHTPQP